MTRRVPFLLPSQRQSEWSPRQFISKLPYVALQVAQVGFGDLASVVLKQYILASTVERKSFEAIGRELGVTKQAAEASCKKVLALLRRTMIADDYQYCTVRFKAAFVEPIRRLARTLEGQSALSESDWNRVIARTWHVKASQLGPAETLILELLNLRRFNFGGSIRPIIGVSGNKTLLADAGLLISRLLTKYPVGLKMREIVDAVHANRRLRDLDEAKIRVVLQSLTDIRRRGQHFRLRELAPRTRVDQYYHILKTAAKPLHYRELARRAIPYGFRGSLGESSIVTNILTRDGRFAPVAHSGFWALTEWQDIETRTITEIISDELRGSRTPLDEDQLFAAIRKCRPAKKRSIARMLAASKKFRRIRPKVWSLADTTC